MASTLYNNVQQFCDDNYGSATQCPTLLLIKDNNNGIFGAFVTEMWRSNSGTGAADLYRYGRAGSSSNLVTNSTSSMIGARGRSYYGTGER